MSNTKKKINYDAIIKALDNGELLSTDDIRRISGCKHVERVLKRVRESHCLGVRYLDNGNSSQGRRQRIYYYSYHPIETEKIKIVQNCNGNYVLPGGIEATYEQAMKYAGLKA